MKHISSIAIALAAVATASLAQAADIPGRRAAVAPAPSYAAAPPLFTWTGFYVGVNAGYGFSGKNSASYTGDAAYLAQGANVPRSYGLKRNGFVGGGTVGYNIQSGSFVGGVEADLNASGASNKTQAVIAPNATGTASGRLGAFGTVRARAGVLLTDRWLAYGTAGVMIGQTRLSSALTGTAAPLTPGGRAMTCSVHGTALAPRQGSAPAQDQSLGKLLSSFAGLEATLTFLEDGLHAVVTIDRGATERLEERHEGIRDIDVPRLAVLRRPDLVVRLHRA